MRAMFLVTTLFCALAANAAAWAPAAGVEQLSAYAPLKISAPKAIPADRAYPGAEEVLRKEFFLYAITADFPEREVTAQMNSFPNVFPPEHGLRLALETLVYEHRDPTSPLARVLHSMGAASPSKEQLEAASDHLLRLMNDANSVIRLASTAAPRGETVGGSWIFSLNLGCCRGTYWAVVSRIGAVPAYSYGTN